MKYYTILVTGGNGFIGSHLVKRLKSQRHRVVVVDTVGPGYNLDIGSPQLARLMLRLKPQVVYHLAADNRVTSPAELTLKSNVIGTFNVLEACRIAKIKQFIFSSSAAVYGESKELPIRESWPTRPISAYGISKLTDELYARLFLPHFTVTLFRFANVYGSGQNSSAEGGAVAIFIRRILDSLPITVYGSGRQTRDFIYVGDVVDALTMVLGKKTPFGAMNIGSNLPTSVVKLIKLLEKLTGKSAVIKFLPKRHGEIAHSLFSYDLAKSQIGWEPKTSLEEGLSETVNFNLTGIK